jgi:hypothetical protein
MYTVVYVSYPIFISIVIKYKVLPSQLYSVPITVVDAASCLDVELSCDLQDYSCTPCKLLACCFRVFVVQYFYLRR